MIKKGMIKEGKIYTYPFIMFDPKESREEVKHVFIVKVSQPYTVKCYALDNPDKLIAMDLDVALRQMTEI